MNTSPMKLFTQGLLPSLTTPIGPAMALVIRPSPVKNTITPRQKMTACTMPSRREPELRLMKYETVNGIIGKTQGVKIAASPATNVVSRKKPRPEDCGFCTGMTGAAAVLIGGLAAGGFGRNSVYPAGITTASAFAVGSMLMVASAV